MNIIFYITQQMVADFAELTGDDNSLHTDEQFARKSKYRQQVVHGMLPFSFLAYLQQEFPNQRLEFIHFDTSFRKPVFIGDQIRLEVSYSKLDARTDDRTFEYKASWYYGDREEILIKSKGNFHLLDVLTEESQDNEHQPCLVLDSLSEKSYSIQTISDQTGGFNFSLYPSTVERYKELILTQVTSKQEDIQISNNLMATLLLSTLVGMELPGKYATFAKFKFSFQKSTPASTVLKLKGKVDKVSVASESIETIAAITQDGDPIAEGKLNVSVNPPPKQTISCAEIKDRYMDFGVRDRVAIVTGASRGIGATTAKLLAMYGAKVVVNYYKGKDDAELVVEDIRRSGGTAIALQCDIRDEQQVKKLVDRVVEEFGTVHILVNNAIKEANPKSYMQLVWHDYISELEVSLKGMHNCCQVLTPLFKKAKQGKIINLSTIFVEAPVNGQNKYITVKSAVVGYTTSLAKELADSNIQVNLVTPNMVETDLVACIPSNFTERIAKERPLKRNLQPIEVAQSILFLASNWTDAMTGQKIVLNLGDFPFG